MDQFLEIIKAGLLGLLQGLTEFLPISSSGHIELGKLLFNFEADLFFTVLLHAGTLLAVLLAFRHQIWQLLQALTRLVRGRRKEGDPVLARIWLLLLLGSIGTIPTALLMYKISDFFNDHPKALGINFIITALILIATSFVKSKKDYQSFQPIRALVIGLAQGVATLPAISRSGLTIASGLALGLKREEAGEFSFLLAIPAIGGALGFEFKDLPGLSLKLSPLSVITGFLAAFGSGLLAIIFLLKLIKSGRLWIFSLYLIPLGLAVIIWA